MNISVKVISVLKSLPFLNLLSTETCLRNPDHLVWMKNFIACLYAKFVTRNSIYNQPLGIHSNVTIGNFNCTKLLKVEKYNYLRVQKWHEIFNTPTFVSQQQYAYKSTIFVSEIYMYTQPNKRPDKLRLITQTKLKLPGTLKYFNFSPVKL